MGLILCVLAFGSVAFVMRRSLGDGLGLLLAIGSVYGIARCNVFDGYTHFLFDAAVLGAYLGTGRRLFAAPDTARRRLRAWVFALSLLPLFLILLSPLMDTQPLPVQLLGLRPAAFFLPLVLVGSALGTEEMGRLARWAVPIVLIASAFAFAEYTLGIERFFPVNEASDIIYRARDVGEDSELRIPATFNSSHAYGGTMVSLIPLLVYLLERPGRWRAAALAAIVLAAIGVFASAARTPVLALAAVALALAMRGFPSPSLRLGLVAVACALLVVVPRIGRFQRFETLSDVGYATARIEGSVNAGFIDTIVEDPFGRGLGSALGTSIPYFLADQARPQIGMENEYVRIAVEEGLLGLCLWAAFALYVLGRNPFRLGGHGVVVGLGIWMVCAFTWLQGFIGVGMLASVPGTAILLIYMGLLAVEHPSSERKIERFGGYRARRLAPQ
jgi:hypothetical protein